MRIFTLIRSTFIPLFAAGIVLSLTFANPLEGQNLVPNPSFETYSSLPSGYGQITKAVPWYSVNWSCDYFHVNATSGSVSIPNTGFGTENARTGQAFVGIAYSSSNSYHELMGVGLTSPLTVGQTYYFEAYVSVGESPYYYATDNFGIYISTTQQSGIPAVTPDFNHTSVITTYSGWEQVSGTFTATVAGTHMTVGNFYSPAATTWVNHGAGGSIGSSYWFIEDVLLQPSAVLDAGDTELSVTLDEEVGAALRWTTNDATNTRYFAIHRSLDAGDSYVEIAKIDVNGDKSENWFSFRDTPGVSRQHVHYRIKEVMTDGTVHFSPLTEIYMPYPGFAEGTHVYPNPVASGTEVTLSFPMISEDHTARVALLDLNGRELYSEEVTAYTNQAEVQIPTDQLSAGIYLAKVICDGQSAVEKVTIR